MSRLTLEQIWPPLALRLEAGDLCLRVLRAGQVVGIQALEGDRDSRLREFLGLANASPRKMVLVNTTESHDD